MAHRIFVALPTSDAFKKEVESWNENFKVKNPDVYDKIRWMPPENLHITLIPPFNKDDGGIKNTLEALTNVEGKTGHFNIFFEKVSYGPTFGHPRLIWISGRHEERVEALKRKIEGALKTPSDKRQFSPHVTIARFREYDFRTFSLKRLDESFEFRETCLEFVLMESKTLPSGAVYQVLGRFKT